MDWMEFLDTADRLAQGLTEGDWRSAISRAYYAVFHFFREWFAANGLSLGRSGQSHFNLYSGLLNCGVTALAGFGTRVDDLRDYRVWADYDLTKSVDQVISKTHVRQAQKLVADFQALLQTISAAQIVAGTRKYLQSIGKIVGPP